MEDELDDKAEETCANAYSDEVDLASIATEVKWICCGKVFQSMISLAIHTKRIHGKCCCYLTNAKTSVQCQDCDEKFTRKRSLKMSCTFCEKNLSSYPQLDSVIKTTHVSNDCCNCGFKSCFGNVLRTRLLVKHGIRIIQVKLSNCDKCSQTFVLKSNFGSHIQSSHVWTDHKKPAVLINSLFITEQDEFITEQGEDLTTKVVVRRMTAPLPFLLRWSRSHYCSPCLPPLCSLLCKTRSLIAEAVDLWTKLLLSASPLSSLFMAEMLLAALPGSRRFMTVMSCRVGYPGPFRGENIIQLSALKSLLLGTNSLFLKLVTRRTVKNGTNCRSTCLKPLKIRDKRLRLRSCIKKCSKC